MPDWPNDPDERPTPPAPDEPHPPAEPDRDRGAGGGEGSSGEAAGDLSDGGASITGAPRPPRSGEEALDAIDAPARRRSRRRRTVPPEERRPRLTAQQRLLLLDTWSRSGLSCPDFASMVGVSSTTLYKWKRRFDEEGPSALEDAPRKSYGSRLPDVTKRAILLMKRTCPVDPSRNRGGDPALSAA